MSVISMNIGRYASLAELSFLRFLIIFCDWHLRVVSHHVCRRHFDIFLVRDTKLV